MPYLKIMNEAYCNPDAVDNVILYITQAKQNPNARDVMYIGSATCFIEPDECIKQMKYIKMIWGKTKGRQIRHFILSFSHQNEYISPEELIQLGKEIAIYYELYYQTIWAIHTRPNYHIHFAVNTVSYQDGRMYREGREDLERLAEYIRGLLPDSVGELKYSYGRSGEGMELL